MASRLFFNLGILFLIFSVSLYFALIHWKVDKIKLGLFEKLSKPNKLFNYPQIKVPEIDCALLFNGQENKDPKLKEETDRAVNAFNGTLALLNLNVTSFIQKAKENSVETYCEEFKRVRGYFTQPLSQEEADFPIAYSIVVYKVCFILSTKFI